MAAKLYKAGYTENILLTGTGISPKAGLSYYQSSLLTYSLREISTREH